MTLMLTCLPLNMRRAKSLSSKVMLGLSSLESINTRLHDNYDDQYGWFQLLGWLSHISGYRTSQATNTVIWNQVEKPITDYTFEAAVAQGSYVLNNESDRANADYFFRSAEGLSLKRRLDALLTRMQWDIINREFRKSRTDVVRDLYEKQRSLFKESGRALNFIQRLDYISAQGGRDLREALARLSVATAGMNSVFSYSAPLPQSIRDQLRGGTRPSNCLDDAAQYVRSASAWLMAFNQLDRIYTAAFSLRSLISPSDWNRSFGSGQFSFEISPSLFPKQSFIRFRGLSLSTAGLNGWVSARIVMPAQSFYLNHDSVRRPINQTGLEVLRIGAVRPQDSYRSPEVVGMAAAYNASPFGAWNLSLPERSNEDEELHNLRDVLIELTVAYQSST